MLTLFNVFPKEGTYMSLAIAHDLTTDFSKSMAHTVTFKNVCKTFTSKKINQEVLRNVNFDIKSGEIVAVVGPSGSGKSTLLRQLAGLDNPTSGNIFIDEKPVKSSDSRTAVGFQEHRLLPWRTLAQNVAIGLPKGTSKTVSRERIAQLLELVGLSSFADQLPKQVSGGMASRVSLARALARNPGVLLLDEPFGALDALTKIKMQNLLLKVQDFQPTTVLLITHDIEEALYLADRVLILRNIRTDSSKYSSIARIVDVPSIRPRNRSELAKLRDELLTELGVNDN